MSELRPALNIAVPDADAGGHFADFANIPNTPDQFVFDFAAITMPPQTASAPDGMAGGWTPRRPAERT